MALYIPDNGCLTLIDVIAHWINNDLGTLTPGNLSIRLYKSAHTPAWGDTDLDYDEADFDGYAPISLTPMAVGTSTEPFALGTFPDAVWTLGAGSPSSNDIYGYYVTDATFGLVWAEERVGGPVTINVTGQTITVSPKFNYGNCICP